MGGRPVAARWRPGAAAQLRKVRKPVGVDQMVCTGQIRQSQPGRSKRSQARRRPPQTAAAPPAWKSAVAKASWRRCADAKRIALQNGDLEAAEAKRRPLRDTTGLVAGVLTSSEDFRAKRSCDDNRDGRRSWNLILSVPAPAPFLV